MNRILLSLGWEYGRLLVGYTLLAVMAIVFIPYLTFVVSIGVPKTAFESYRFHLPYLGVIFCMLGGLTVKTHDEVLDRLFLKPLSNKFLFAWLTLVPLAVIVAAHCIATAIITSTYGADWPFVRPAFYLAATTATAFATRWLILLRQYIWGAAFAFGAGLILLACGYRGYFPNGVRQPLVLDNLHSLVELGGLAFVLATSLLVVNWSVGALRSGGGAVAPTDAVDATSREMNPPREFTSAQSAMGWLHRRTAMQALAGTAIASLMAAALQILIAAKGEPPADLAFVMANLLSVGSAVGLGAVLGLGIRLPGDQAKQAMSTFLSTKPLSDQQHWNCLARALLLGAAGCTAILVLVGVCLPLAVSRLYFQAQPLLSFETATYGHIADIPGPLHVLAQRCGSEHLALVLWACFIFVIIASLASIVATLAMMCRDRLLSTSVAASVTIGIAGFFFIAWCRLSADQNKQLVLTLSSILLLVMISIACWGFSRAWQRKFLGMKPLVIAAGVLALSAYCVGVYPVTLVGGVKQLLLFCTLSLGIPLAPIAMSFARHR